MSSTTTLSLPALAFSHSESTSGLTPPDCAKAGAAKPTASTKVRGAIRIVGCSLGRVGRVLRRVDGTVRARGYPDLSQTGKNVSSSRPVGNFIPEHLEFPSDTLRIGTVRLRPLQVAR